MRLIQRACQGRREDRATLAELARGKAFAYIYRVTLDYDLAQDLAQETVVRLLEHLPRLRFAHAGAFWSWIFRTALSRVQEHGRRQSGSASGIKTTIHTDMLADHVVVVVGLPNAPATAFPERGSRSSFEEPNKTGNRSRTVEGQQMHVVRHDAVRENPVRRTVELLNDVNQEPRRRSFSQYRQPVLNAGRQRSNCTRSAVGLAVEMVFLFSR